MGGREMRRVIGGRRVKEGLKAESLGQRSSWKFMVGAEENLED
jgi:hypothetical protein